MSKKNKYSYDKYTQGIFPISDLYVSTNFDEDYINKQFKSTDNTKIECNDVYAAVYYNISKNKSDKLCILVLICPELVDKKGRISEELYGTIAHEAFHVAHRMLQYCEIPLTDSTTEAYAYLSEWATKCILKTCSKKQ